MRIGSLVQLIEIPPDISVGDAWLPTQSTFKRCLGCTLRISGFNDVGWAELDIEQVTGSVGETIWVEPAFLRLVSDAE
jgi:hypothetical protein